MQMHRVVGSVALGLILLGYTASYAQEPRQLVFSPGASQRKEAAGEQERAVQAKEIKRLELLVVDKNKAIDVSIVEIKKLYQQKNRLLDDNPYLSAAYETTGWEKVQLDGLPDVSVKPSGGDTIVRVPMFGKAAGIELLAPRSRALFTCNGMFCFVVPTSILASAQPAGPTER